MKRNEIFIVGALIMLAVAWPQIADRLYKAPPAPPVPPGGSPGTVTNAVPAIVNPGASTNQVVQIGAPTPLPAVTNPPPTAPVAQLEGKTELLENDLVRLIVSSIGASITEADLMAYPAEKNGDGTPVRFDFAQRPSLAYTGIPGLGLDVSFDMKVLEPGRKLELSTRTPQGVKLTRVLTLGDSYLLDVVDTLASDAGQTLALPNYDIQLGPVHRLPDVYAFGYTIGIDALLQQGAGVEHYGKKMHKWLKKSESGSYDEYMQSRIDWVAVKNKFFCHLLTVKQGDLPGARDFRLIGIWDAEKKMAGEASTAVQFEGFNLVPGTAYVREFSYFIGPKKLSELKKLNEGQDEVMEFWGFLKPISKAVLWLMNKAYGVVKNYGVAIILLTLFIRILFWPLTHKSNESMKKMQALGPEMKALREKFKDNPQKQHEAVMGLYKSHKVNPLSGCLPMLIQFPVFIALFYVIRSAVELRFASFLWVGDLSEPEKLFYDSLNFPLNILPVAMAGTMFVQQKLTPSTMDPAQQKIMQFFPIMLLFILYNMPSGLLLYWTTSNLLMILQQMHNLKKNREEAEEAGPAPPAPKPLPQKTGGGGSKSKSRKKRK